MGEGCDPVLVAHTFSVQGLQEYRFVSCSNKDVRACVFAQLTHISCICSAMGLRLQQPHSLQPTTAIHATLIPFPAGFDPITGPTLLYKQALPPNMLAVTIQRSDSLRLDRLLTSPVVRLHVLDAKDGSYLSNLATSGLQLDPGMQAQVGPACSLGCSFGPGSRRNRGECVWYSESRGWHVWHLGSDTCASRVI